MSQATNLPEITNLLKSLSDAKLILDPLLHGMRGEFFRNEANSQVVQGKQEIMSTYYHDRHVRQKVQDVLRGSGNDPFVENCVEDFLVCTAVCISHDLYGRVHVDRDIAQMAVNDVRALVDHHGLPRLCQCYVSIIGLENCQAVAYYQRISVEDFVEGRLHRPWAPHPLHNELNGGLTLGLYNIVQEDNRRYVKLTDRVACMGF